jgi:DNA-entry nuclease
MKRRCGFLVLWLCCAALLLTGCTPQGTDSYSQLPETSVSGELPDAAGEFDPLSVPDFSGTPFAEVNGNVPFFTHSDLTHKSFEYYSLLDSLGRCGVTFSCVGTDIMPTEKRGSIGMVKPTGWQMDKYDFIDGKYLYNRCHLQGYQLTGENANERNLITGTRYLNVQGMLPFENQTADYVKSTGNHVLYRVTPCFSGEELVARGVLMEAYSVEDSGEGVCFCVFCYNVCPGVDIDYSSGESKLSENPVTAAAVSEESDCDFVLNTSSKKIHLPDCESVAKIASQNREEFSGSIDELLEKGYTPCKNCHPDQK